MGSQGQTRTAAVEAVARARTAMVEATDKMGKVARGLARTAKVEVEVRLGVAVQLQDLAVREMRTAMVEATGQDLAATEARALAHRTADLATAL